MAGKKNDSGEKFVFVSEEEFRRQVKKPRTSTQTTAKKGTKKK